MIVINNNNKKRALSSCDVLLLRTIRKERKRRKKKKKHFCFCVIIIIIIYFFFFFDCTHFCFCFFFVGVFQMIDKKKHTRDNWESLARITREGQRLVDAETRGVLGIGHVVLNAAWGFGLAPHTNWHMTSIFWTYPPPPPPPPTKQRGRGLLGVGVTKET